MKTRFSKIRKLLSVTLALSVVAGMPYMEELRVEAAAKETTVMRIFSTADLHGQATADNFDSAASHKQGSLAQLSTLIKQSKKTMTYGGTMLVDSGDTVYGFLTENMADGKVDLPAEYMLETMKYMGYDAITLGNHEFDHGLDYIQNAIDESDINDMVVMSNIFDGRTKDHIWAENKVVEKTVKTSKGNKVKVRIGVIGVVVTSLTGQYDWKEDIEVQGILASVEEQVAKLKEKDVDAVIVLAHSGVGTNLDEDYMSENDTAISENYGYEISRIDGVDAVMCGHTHADFPVAGASYSYLAGYDKKTQLFNGKVIIEEADHGQTLGTTDLTFNIVDGKPVLAKKAVSLTKVTGSVAQDSKIVSLCAKYTKAANTLYSEKIMTTDTPINDYFAFLEDNPLIQASNESKIQYGLSYLRTSGGNYKNYPVIACTPLKDVAGTDAGTDYLSVTGNITVGDILKIQNYNQEDARIYYITGKQLKEWLEWQASALYQTANISKATASSWKDASVKSYVANDRLIPVLNEEWIDNWTSFQVFDGIEYDIDTSQAERYTRGGSIKNKNSLRIKNLTRNGVAVKDSDSFALVTTLSVVSHVGQAGYIKEQSILGKSEKLYKYMKEYLLEQASFGVTHLDTDDNFRVLFPEGDRYLIKAGSDSKSYAASRSWYKTTLGTKGGYTYYRAALGGTAADTAGPLLVVADTSTEKVGDPILVAVQASDRSGLKEVKYLSGKEGASSAAWSSAAAVTGNGFTVTANGTYSVRAVDNSGNATVKYVKVSNFQANTIPKPTIAKTNNRKTTINGTAIAGAKVYIAIPGRNLETTATASGTYSVDIDALKVGDVVSVWQTDSRGLTSEKATLTVIRNGANVPDYDAVTNKDSYISGKLNDDAKYCKMTAIIGKTIYVPKDKGKLYYENSTLYDPDLKVVEVDYTVEDGMFELAVPNLYADKTIKLCSLDWVYRRSLTTKLTVEDVAPNKPTVRTVFAEEGMVYGAIPSYSGRETTVSVTDGDYVYEGVVDANGYYAVETAGLKEGDDIRITAEDTVDGKVRTSTAIKTTIGTLAPYEENPKDISFSAITNKSAQIKGKATGYGGETITLIVGGERIPVKVGASGAFKYIPEDALDPGTRVSVVIRTDSGEIDSIGTTLVKLAVPEKPILGNTKQITEKTRTIKVWSDEEYTAVVKVGNTYYKTSKAVYNKKKGVYVYTLKVKDLEAGKKIAVYMENDAGISKRIVVKVADSAQQSEEA